MVKKCKSWNTIILITLLLIVTQFWCVSLEKYAIVNVLEILVFAIGVIICWLIKDYKYINQITPVVLLINIFWLSALISKNTNKDHRIIIIWGTFSLLMMLVLCMKKIHWKNILSNVKSYKGIFIILIVFILLSIETLTEIPLWDSKLYYIGITRIVQWFDFSFGCFYDLNLWDHISIGYSFWFLICEFLFPDNIVVAHIMQVVMGMGIVLGVYLVLCKMFSEKVSQKEILIMTSLFAVSPYILGMIGNFNIDISILFYLVWLTFAYVNDFRILELVFGLGLCFSKENGIVYVFFFAVGIAISQIVKSRNDKRKFIKNIIYPFTVSTNYLYLIIAIIYIVAYLCNTGDRWSNGADKAISWNSEGYNCFGINLNHIIMIIKEYFVLNFNWLIWLIIIGCGMYTLINRMIAKKSENQCAVIESVPIISAFVGGLFFSIVFVTYTHTRYIIPSVFGGTFFLIIVVNKLNNKKARCVIYNVLAILLLIQSFYSVDMVSNKVFCNTDIGSANILSMHDSGSFQLNDSIVYNRQYVYYGKMMEKMLNEIDYDSNKAIVLLEDETIDGYKVWGSYGYQWDMKQRKMVYYESDKEGVISVDSFPHTEIKSLTNYDKIYVLKFQTNNEDILNQVLNQVMVLDSDTITYRGWEVVVYECQLL
jgi:hypothetical protein